MVWKTVWNQGYDLLMLLHAKRRGHKEIDSGNIQCASFVEVQWQTFGGVQDIRVTKEVSKLAPVGNETKKNRNNDITDQLLSTNDRQPYGPIISITKFPQSSLKQAQINLPPSNNELNHLNEGKELILTTPIKHKPISQAIKLQRDHKELWVLKNWRQKQEIIKGKGKSNWSHLEGW